jgi:hypothetical protein
LVGTATKFENSKWEVKKEKEKMRSEKGKRGGRQNSGEGRLFAK